MTQIEVKERLPDWTNDRFERMRMNQLTQILERRFLTIEESLIDLSFRTSGSTATVGGEFAPLEHTHGISEITDFPEDNVVFDPTPGQRSITGDIRLGDIWDVDLTGLQNESIIKWSDAANGGNGGWVIDDLASTGNSLASLTDTVITAAADDDLLQFNGSQWVNVSLASIGYVRQSGDTMSGNLQFTDLISAAFGDFSDSRMFYDGADMFHRVTTGDWILQVNQNENAIVANANGGVELYHNNILMAQTITAGLGGLEVNNTLTGTGLGRVLTDEDVLDSLDDVNLTGAANNDLLFRSAGSWIDTAGDLTWNGSELASHSASGDATIAIDGFTAFDARLILRENGTETGRLQWEAGGSQVELLGTEGSATMLLAGTNSSSAVRNFMLSDPDGDIQIYHPSANAVHLQTDADGVDFPTTGAITLPSGTDAQRPGTPVNGMVRYNTDSAMIEFYVDGQWVTSQAPASLTTSYRFSTTTTSGDPGIRTFRYDNATIASVANIYVDDQNNNNADMGAILGALSATSKIYVQQNSDSTKSALFTVDSAATDNTGWWTIAVTYVSDGGGGIPASNAVCTWVIQL